MYDPVTGEFTSQNLNAIGIVDPVTGVVDSHPSDMGNFVELSDISIDNIKSSKSSYQLVNSDIVVENTNKIMVVKQWSLNSQEIENTNPIKVTEYQDPISQLDERKRIYQEVPLQDLQYWGVSAIGSRNSFYVTGRRINNS